MFINLFFLFCTFGLYRTHQYDDGPGIEFKKPPAEGRRCGICPTYFHKLCAFDFQTNETYIFDNVCIMDLYNCIHGTDPADIVLPEKIPRNKIAAPPTESSCDCKPFREPLKDILKNSSTSDHPFSTSVMYPHAEVLKSIEFVKLNYENCLYFGNFAYVHGLKHEDYDYGEDHFSITHSKKNPDFV